MGLQPPSKTARKPLQPKNHFPNNPTINNTISTKNNVPTINPVIQSLERTQSLYGTDPSNKENFITLLPEGVKSDVKIINIEPFEASLAEELSSMRKRMERLKLDKDKTLKLLKERDLVFDMEMNQLQKRGEAQKQLEIEVDRLFRLKEMRLCCINKSPFRSFREKEEEKKMKKEESQEKNLGIDDTKRDMITMGDPNTTMMGQDGADYK